MQNVWLIELYDATQLSVSMSLCEVQLSNLRKTELRVLQRAARKGGSPEIRTDCAAAACQNHNECSCQLCVSSGTP